MWEPFAFDRRDVASVPVFVRAVPWVTGHAAIRVAFSVGARSDVEGREGLAHFFEHLPFDGCEGAPTHDDVETVRHTLFMDTLNAFTGMEYTVFVGRCRTERIPEALDFFRRLVWKPILDPAELERERQVIVREIWRLYGTPKDLELVRLEWADLMPPGHRFATHFRPLGRPETVGAVTREELLAFHRERYVRENLSIFVVGDAPAEVLDPAIEALVAAVPSGAAFPAPTLIVEPQHPPVPLRDISYKEFFGVSEEARPKNTEVEWSRIVPRPTSEGQLRLAGRLLSRVLKDAIRGKFGATYSVSTYVDIFRDLALVGAHTKVEPARADEVRAHAEATLGTLLAAAPEHAAKFGEVRQAMLDRAEAEEFHTGRIADDAATDWVVDGKIALKSVTVADVRAATYAGTCRLLADSLQPDKCQRLIVRP